MPTFDYNKQSVELPNTRLPGQTGIYRNPASVDGLQDSVTPNTQNAYDLFKLGLNQAKDQKCLGLRSIKNPETGERGPYEWQTYQQVNERILNLGSGLLNYFNKQGIANTYQTPIGIWSINCPDWAIADFACTAYGLFSVALYDTLGPDSVEYIISQAEISTVVCSSQHITDLLALLPKIPSLKTIVSIEPLSSGMRQTEGVTVTDLRTLEKIGKASRREPTPCKPDDLYCIMYTSGTTGMPKGAMLTHRNFLSCMVPVYQTYSCNPSDTGFSFLPLAHIYERMCDMFLFMSGGGIGYYSGNVDTIMADIVELKPSVLPAVPRLLNRIYASLAAATIELPGPQGDMIRRAVAEKLVALEAGRGCTDAHWDKLIFNKVKQALGGRIKLISTGSAPISKEILQFLRVVLCCDIREGYGATETCSAVTIQLPGEYKANHVGSIITSCEFKLVDVPEMEYFATDPLPRGEILIRGHSIFKGYYKEPEKTREALDEGGWYRSGDIGLVDERGCLVIIDRKKNIFKLAQGEYIAPEKIENIYLKHPAIAQMYIHGDSLQSALVAIVVPDPEVLPKIVADALPKISSHLGYAELCQEPKVIDLILSELKQVGKDAQLKGFEIPRAIYLESEPFSIEKDLLTPTLKVKRNQAAKNYREKIDHLYKSLNSSSCKL